MTVGELKKLLENYPDDMELLGRDNDNWYYDYDGVEVRKIHDGRITNRKNIKSVLCLE